MKVLVIGASTNSARYSFMAVNSLNDNGHDVIAIGIKEGKIGKTDIITGKPDLNNVHTISIYISPHIQNEYYNYIIDTVKPKRIIFNPGTENPEFVNLAKKAGIETENACTLVLLSINQF